MRRRIGTTLWNGQLERLVVMLALVMLLAVAAVVAMGAAKRFASPAPNPPPGIVSAPSSPTLSTSAHFTFSDPKQVTAFMCSLDGAAAAAYCGRGTSGSASYSALAAGRHTFTVYALVGSRQSQPVQVNWRIEVAPTSKGSPTSQAGETRAGNLPAQPGRTGAGNHSPRAAKTSAGNHPPQAAKPSTGNPPSQADGTSAGSGNVTTTPRTLDVAPPPVPVFTSTPARRSTSRSARFAFSEHRPSDFDHFECSFEGGPFYRCAGAQTFDRLKSGPHTFTVRAVDKTGNRSHGNAFTWTIEPPLKVTPFTITGNAVGALHPGGSARPVNLVFTNPNSVAIEITKVMVRVKGTSTAACGAGNFQIVQNLKTSPQAIVIPAKSKRSLKALAVPRSQWPRLEMLSSGNKAGCAGVVIHLSYRGAGHS